VTSGPDLLKSPGGREGRLGLPLHPGLNLNAPRPHGNATGKKSKAKRGRTNGEEGITSTQDADMVGGGTGGGERSSLGGQAARKR